MLFHRWLNKGIPQRKGFFREEKGAVILLWAVALVPLLGMLGMAIDLGRVYYVHSVITGASDAAAIAGAKTAGINGDVVGKATAIFNANIPKNFIGTIQGPTVTVANNQVVTVTATGTVPTTFMKVLGQTSIDASATSQAQISNPGAEVVLALDNTGSMTGSPMTAEIQAAQTLVNILYGGAGVNTVPGLYVAVVPYTTTVNINIPGLTPSSWLTAAGKIQITNTNLYPNIAPTATSVGGKWMGCIEARTPPLYASGMDSTDTPPSGAGLFTPFLYPSTMAHQYVFGQPLVRGPLSTSTNALASAGSPPWGTTGATRGDNDWKLDGTVPGGSNLRFGDNYNIQGGNGDGNYAVGPNLGCPVPMLPLTASQTTVQNTISSMRATSRGGTMINVGLASAWWMISPKWQGLWPGVPAGMPKAYGQTAKFVVLMTDGQNQWYDWPSGVPGQPDGSHNYAADADYTGYGRLAEGRTGTTVFGNTINLLNTSMLTMCTNLKNNGVTVYTILFNHDGSASGAGTQAAFQSCATDPTKYFLAVSNADLQAAFSNIGQSITSLRLTWPGKP
jgi:Flp pilus assembly protein TadG